ncbi:MAG TPA: ATP-binding protein [Actinomycetes bacterium]|nr:ATP-binding protein [Actinomycetes bacterium]
MDFRGVLDGFADAVVAADGSGRIVYANRSAGRLLGWPDGGLVGQPLTAIQPPRLHQAHLRGFRRYLEDRTPRLLGRPVRVPAMHRDGREIDIELTISAVPDGRGELFVASLRDLGDRIELEEAIAAKAAAEAALDRASALAEAGTVLASSLDYRTTLSNVAELLVPRMADGCRVDLCDEDGELRLLASANADPDWERAVHELEERFPIAKREWSGQVKAIRSGEPELVERLDDEQLRGRALDPELLELVRAMQVVSYLCVPLFARDRVFGALTYMTTSRSGRQLGKDDLRLVAEVARIAGLAIDNSHLYQQAEEARQELERSNRDLQRSNTELEEFAYIVSHDLAEPLRTMTGFTQLLQRRYQGQLDAEADTFLNFVVDGAARMRALLGDLLTYSRAGRHDLELQPVDVAELVERSLLDLAPVIEEQKASVEVGPLPTVQGDPTQLGQVVQNLLGNALKFHPPGASPRIRVSGTRVEGAWRISVADNGIGIDPAQQERVFRMFQRLHGRGEYSGTGVGLAVCKRIVERHRGRIWFERNEGGGTVFCFTVPD